MGNTNGGVGFVDMLTACAAGAVGINSQIGRVDLNRNRFIGFGKYGNSTRAGMNAPLCFCGGNALYAVAARLKLQSTINVVAFDLQNHFFVAAELTGRFAHDFGFPALAVAVTGVHACQIGCK